MNKKNIVVTGGAGFIGSHIAEYHLKKGNQVWIVDSLAAGRMENISGIEKNPALRFDKVDIREWKNRQEAMNWADHVYHMAAIVGQRQVLADPINTLQNNIQSCEALLESLSKAPDDKKRRFIVASSSSVYIHQQFEGEKGFNEKSPVIFYSGEVYQETYPLGKFVDEVATLSYVAAQGLDCVIARIFNTIGPNQRSRYGMVVPTFVGQALNNEPLTVFGDGSQTRSFCNVQDTLRGLELLLETHESKGQIVNLGNDREYSILDLAKMVIAKCNSKSEIRFVPYKEAYGIDFKDVTRRRPDLDKLKGLTGYKPMITLEQTVDEIIAFKRSRGSSP